MLLKSSVSLPDSTKPERGAEENEVEEGTHIENIMLADRPGTFQQAITVHERYAVRPRKLENMCLAQFATIYTKVSKASKRTIFDDDGCSLEKNRYKLYREQNLENAIQLPKYIDLRKYNLGIMGSRQLPFILRIHNSKKKEGLEGRIKLNAKLPDGPISTLYN